MKHNLRDDDDIFSEAIFIIEKSKLASYKGTGWTEMVKKGNMAIAKKEFLDQ